MAKTTNHCKRWWVRESNSLLCCCLCSYFEKDTLPLLYYDQVLLLQLLDLALKMFLFIFQALH